MEARIGKAFDTINGLAEVNRCHIVNAYRDLTNRERAIARAQMTRSGHVYIISNIGSFGEHVYKSVMTRRLDPMDRIHELTDASVPFHFDVHAVVSRKMRRAWRTNFIKSFIVDGGIGSIFGRSSSRSSLRRIAAAVHEHHERNYSRGSTTDRKLPSGSLNHAIAFGPRSPRMIPFASVFRSP
ncbi:MAG: uncharacterized protein JWO97_4780 [Acidobacteria bacterium]|nr:uncharacterized protein [Acidobacteriota bacterium]